VVPKNGVQVNLDLRAVLVHHDGDLAVAGHGRGLLRRKLVQRQGGGGDRALQPKRTQGVGGVAESGTAQANHAAGERHVHVALDDAADVNVRGACRNGEGEQK
jgi:hypothetical protein